MSSEHVNNEESHKNRANHTPDTVMIGVDLFDDSDTDGDNKLQLYSDVDGGLESDAVIESSAPLLRTPEKIKRRTKTLRDTARLSLEDRIKCIRLCSRYNSYADAQKAWKQNYDTIPPCRKTMSTLDKKFQKTGSVADLVRTGRPKTTRTEAVIARVEEAVNKDPTKSIRALAKDLGITQASVHRIRKEIEDKRNTLKLENRKLRDRLNEALKRIGLLEKRCVQEQQTETVLPTGVDSKYETLVITAPDGTTSTGIATFSQDTVEGQTGTGVPTIITLSNTNNQILRLAGGQEAIHFITLSQPGTQVLSAEESSSFQLSIPTPTSQIPINRPNFN